MSILEMHVIDLLEADDSILKETKISSSSRRREALGNLLKQPTPHPERSHFPYIIGLTGGIASGKSNIAKYLMEEADFEVSGIFGNIFREFINSRLGFSKSRLKFSKVQRI